MTALTAVVGWAAAAWAGPCDDAAAVAERSAAIKAIYDEGEAERADRTVDAKSVLARDEDRVDAMVKYDGRGQLCTPDDKWYAAWVMTQADKTAIIERAYTLANEAMEAHHANGAWLVAFTFDLKRIRGGYRQSYGTQTQIDERGNVCLVEVEPDVTDAERAKYHQPPLADQIQRVLQTNGFGSDEPTLDRLKRRNLYCAPVANNRHDQRRVAPPAP